MKKYFKKIILIGLLFPNLLLSQITTLNVSSVTQIVDSCKYDSLQNFISDRSKLYCLIGQEFYILPKDSALREYGYSGFVKDYRASSTDYNNIYKRNKSFGSDYNKVVNKYFIILDVVKTNKYSITNYFLKIKEKISGDILYYEYPRYESSMDIIIVGYFEKMNYKYNTNYYLIPQRFNWTPIINIKTGKEIRNDSSYFWKCINLTIDSKYYNLVLVLENDKKEQAIIELKSFESGLNSECWGGTIIPKSLYMVYNEKFGINILIKIINGDIEIGMTKEMIKLAIGKPEKINYTINNNFSHEQWVYHRCYLYFINQTLTSISNK